MRRHLSLFIALCLAMAARGQTALDELDLSGLPQPTQAKALRYWFDDDNGSMQTLNQLSGHQTLNVSGLIEGLHTLHYQVIDSEDGVAYVRSTVFLKTGQNTATTVQSLRYWFDDDGGNVKTANGTSGTYLLDTSELIEGLHTLHYQITDDSNTLAYVGSSIFLKMNSGQDATSVGSLHYWFDDDAGNAKTATSTGIQTLEVSSLLDGLHTIHYQVTGSDGIAAYIASGLFLKMGSNIEAEGLKASKLMYWFDDETTIQNVDISEGTQMLNASGLIEGLHTIHYQVLCNNGQMTPAMSSLFLRMNIDTETAVAKSLWYWFDDEQTSTEVEITDGVQLLDASSLVEGLHTVHYQIANSNGTLGAPYSSIFLMMNWDNATTAKSLRYWFDEETAVTETAVSNGTQALDASRLLEGLHTVHYQIVDSNGILGAPASSVFLKMDFDNAAAIAKSIRYWFDDDATKVRVTDVANGTQTLDVSDLLTGLHTLNYQLIDSNGRVGVPVTRLFIKNFDKVLADGHNRVMKYQYWLNQNSQGIQTVELADASNPYTLIALLPMQKEPIQSSQFHFEVTDDVPTIYAKNTFHVRFHDAQGYFTDGDKSFVDYSVKQEVIPVGELQTTQTFDKVAENEVRWYTMQAAPGDTAAFRLSQPATVQVFAPSGAEVFKTSESASVKWGGIHTWEDGTYYLAVHDVTGSQSTMKLEYMHMDKYDVVDWDVHTVGNGGCSTITFKGNGFSDLYAVDLVIAPGDTIHSVDVSNDNDAETAVTFDFTDAALGEYNAVFHFTEEDKPIANVVIVEEAVDIELATTVTFPSTFLRGTSTTYTVKITNLGNMTAYAVPIFTWLKSKTKNGINKVTYEGLNLNSFISGINTDSLSSSSIETLHAYSNQLSDDHYFMHFFVQDENNPGDSVYVRSNYFYTNLSPNTSKTIRLVVSSSETVDAYFTIPKEWHSYSIVSSSPNFQAKAHFAKSSAMEWYCCYRERIECLANITVNGLDIASLFSVPGPTAQNIAACVAGTINQILTAAGDTYCGKNDVQGDFMKKVNNVVKGISIAGVVSSCASMFGVKNASEIGVALDNLLHPSTAVNCIQAFFKPIPDCPPCVGCGNGGGSSPVPPVDPNDIFGYLSEAGSKFIADSVARVNYTIEFENDTTFAEAAAHTIVIRDTLDSRYFDLTKFMPTGIRIGSREALLDEADVVTSNDKTSFVKTIDMRPEINAIAQVDGTFNQTTHIAEWTIQSLDPMTMEPTDDLMQGILPVNYDGTSGIGEVMFEVGVKQGKADGTEISNRAGIVFDYEEAILTPTWTNIVDGTAPKSRVTDVHVLNDSTATVIVEANDELSGLWRYNVYVQYGTGAWFLAAENVAADTTATVKIYEGIEHHFYCVATDMAGNVEQKEPTCEVSMTMNTVFARGDVNGDHVVDALDASLILQYVAHKFGDENTDFIKAAADTNNDNVIDALDASLVLQHAAKKINLNEINNTTE